MRVQFSKMHGLGNDFVLINNLELQHSFSACEIKFIANRKLGVGCDQVLLINHASDGLSDFFYAIYNSDGSIAEQCGNGARCFIRYIVDHGLSTKQQLRLQILGGSITGCQINENLYQVSLGEAVFTPALIPLVAPSAAAYYCEGEISFAALSVGNPHAVIELASREELAQDEKLAKLALKLQNSGLFPEGVNVNFVYYHDASKIELRTYERGCGFTEACGSGACASAVIAIREARASGPVLVNMPGGSLVISLEEKVIVMQGPAAYVFNGELNL